MLTGVVCNNRQTSSLPVLPARKSHSYSLFNKLTSIHAVSKETDINADIQLPSPTVRGHPPWLLVAFCHLFMFYLCVCVSQTRVGPVVGEDPNSGREICTSRALLSLCHIARGQRGHSGWSRPGRGTREGHWRYGREGGGRR